MWGSYFSSLSHRNEIYPEKRQIISSARNDTCTEYQIWLSCENETEETTLLSTLHSSLLSLSSRTLALSLSHTIVFHLTVTFDIDSHKWHATLAAHTLSLSLSHTHCIHCASRCVDICIPLVIAQMSLVLRWTSGLKGKPSWEEGTIDTSCVCITHKSDT